MIELQDVHKTYDTGTKALNGISMKIDDGEFVFLVGPSGSGKSTIIKILTAELRPTSGSALVNGFAVEKLRGRAVPYLRRTLGVIFQDFRRVRHARHRRAGEGDPEAGAVRARARRARDQGPASAQ